MCNKINGHPCHLKVGDWVDWGEGPVQVTRVDNVTKKFWDTTTCTMDDYAVMNGRGYTVVPAPKGGA